MFWLTTPAELRAHRNRVRLQEARARRTPAQLAAERRQAQERATAQWLANRKLRIAESETMEPDAFAAMVTIPEAQRSAEDAINGWRFGAAMKGAIASPWVPGFTWPSEGQAAACMLQGDGGVRAPRHVADLRVLAAHGLDAVPVNHCACGLYLERDLHDLLRPMPPGSARIVAERTMGWSHLGAAVAVDPKKSYWGMERPPDVIYQAQGWGRRAPADDPNTALRFQYVRVRPGGRVHLHRSREDHAERLAAKYDVQVVVGHTYGWGWLEEIVERETDASS